MTETYGGVQLVGASRLRRTLKAAGDDLQDLKQAHAAAAQLAAGRARAIAPRGRTGRLAGSIRPTATGTVAMISATAAHAGVINYGWPAHGISSQPFMNQAAQDTEPHWLPIYLKALDRALSTIKGI